MGESFERMQAKSFSGSMGPVLKNLFKNTEDLKAALLGREIEDTCIGECGSEFTAYVGDDLITASSEEDFIEQCK